MKQAHQMTIDHTTTAMRICAAFLMGIALLLAACQQNEYDRQVHHAGTMKQIMSGDIAPVEMSDSLDFDHLYALGALGHLKGELLVWDGEPYLARMGNGELVVSNSREFDASLLVYAKVPQWQQVNLSSLPSQGSFIDDIMAKSARQKGWDGQSPFPFRLEGRFDKLAYHVIDWPAGDSVHTHDKHRTSGVIDTLHDVEAQLLGFYSNRHHGIFTHHGTNGHIHFKTSDGKIAGHVDGFEPGTELKMYLPHAFEESK